MAQRILCVLGKMKSGGVESIMLSYYRCLDKTKYQYDFIYEDGSTDEFPKDVLEMGARAFKVPSVGSLFAYIKAIRKIIKSEGYNIVHANVNTLSLFSLFAAWSCGVKYRILHNHTTSSPIEKKRTFLKKILRPFNLMFANKRCACSELAARWMYGNKAVDSGKVTIFRNGVDVDKFKFSNEYREEIRNEFNLENKKVIGHIGRFMTQKNHFFLIDLFEKYAHTCENAVLLLVGGGELLERVRSYVCEKGLSDKVVFAGVRRDVHKFYSAFDVFVLPSLYEGLPVVGMEACASGVPVLLSEEITRECAITDTVSFLPIKDPSVWADALLSIKEGSRESASNQMKNGPYNIHNCVKVLENYYSQCKKR